ncbi:hypothetical protein HYX70_04495 [Candidatus Saccharibacteria bacterium]|nr:hypothetical protein [Candidatus Saccharibacteria bacterium]
MVQLAIKAARVMRREVAGVDVIQDQDGQHLFLLEVNGTPQIDTGSMIEYKLNAMARYLDSAADPGS